MGDCRGRSGRELEGGGDCLGGWIGDERHEQMNRGMVELMEYS